MLLSDKAKALIYQYEGVDQPGQWPGGGSGVSIGYGYDLGYESLPDFNRDWSPHLRPAYLARLAACCGLKGNAAAKAALQLNDIRIMAIDAKQVFETRSVPKYMKQLVVAMPGIEALPSDAIGGLFSLVYNRGPKMDGDSRAEMRAIRDAVAEYAKPDANRHELLKEIAVQLRSMKRLWIGRGLNGLVQRREMEAQLVENCTIAQSSVP